MEIRLVNFEKFLTCVKNVENWQIEKKIFEFIASGLYCNTEDSYLFQHAHSTVQKLSKHKGGVLSIEGQGHRSCSKGAQMTILIGKNSIFQIYSKTKPKCTIHAPVVTCFLDRYVYVTSFEGQGHYSRYKSQEMLILIEKNLSY